jgi:hypothetical protein
MSEATRLKLGYLAWSWGSSSERDQPVTTPSHALEPGSRRANRRVEREGTNGHIGPSVEHGTRAHRIDVTWRDAVMMSIVDNVTERVMNLARRAKRSCVIALAQRGTCSFRNAIDGSGEAPLNRAMARESARSLSTLAGRSAAMSATIGR